MKKIMMIITVIILSLVVFMGCSKANEPALPSSTTHYGGAVLLNGDGEVPENLYIDSGIYKAENQGILKKTMDVYGIKFIAQEDVPDDFMLSVAKTYKEMFQVTENTDLELQEKVIENLYKHNTVLPIIINEKEATIDVFESLIANNSICDIILVTDEYQEMEVVEHLLHSITDVGLSYTFESDWGFAEDSRVSKTMNQAIESKFYDISNYNYGEKDIKNRIIVQEYAYWLISSNWNLQENFGLGEEEWKLPNISKIENELSDGYLLLTETVDKVITSPSIQTLDELNNKTTSNNIDKEQNITNENYQVFVDEGDIKTDVETINKKFKGNFTKYIQYIAPNGKPITIIGQDKISDEQLLKSYNIISFYLTSHKDYDMDKVANQMADNEAILMMPNGADGDKKLKESVFYGQPVYEMEAPVTGDKWYINNDYEHRDASYEEILHLVHDYGIGTTSNPGALPGLQEDISKAMTNALPSDKSDWGKEGKGLWGYESKEWLDELSKEGSLEQEYIVSVVDSYYGLWGSFTENDKGMWGIYIAKTREDIKEKDPTGYEVLESFLPKDFTYMDRVDGSFEGTFNMTFDEEILYTHKSQYIRNIRLTGQNNSNIVANDKDNLLMGNVGDNILDGGEGYDIVQFNGSSDEYIIDGNTVEDTLKRDGKDVLVNIEVLRFTDKDIIMN